MQTQARGSGSLSGMFMATLCGYREADITPDEYKKAREALRGLRKRWELLASGAVREAESRQTQRFNMTSQQFLNAQEVLRLQVLEHIAQVGQASDGPAQVARWVTDVLTMYAGDTVPADEEAVRFILSFASSLSDPGLGVAPSIAAMPSLTTLVPHYDVSAGCMQLLGHMGQQPSNRPLYSLLDCPPELITSIIVDCMQDRSCCLG